jgi:hypothetical protein
LHDDPARHQHGGQHAPGREKAQQDYEQSVAERQPAGGGDVHIGPYTVILGKVWMWSDLVPWRGAVSE